MSARDLQVRPEPITCPRPVQLPGSALARGLLRLAGWQLGPAATLFDVPVIYGRGDLLARLTIGAASGDPASFPQGTTSFGRGAMRRRARG